MNFADVTEWRIPQGDVVRVTDSQNRIIWERYVPDYTEPFYVKNLYNGASAVRFEAQSNAPAVTVEYSTDRVNWYTLGTTSSSETLRYNMSSINEKVYFRANTTTWATLLRNFIYTYDDAEIGGNIMSLMYGSNFTGSEVAFPASTGTFSHLFSRWGSWLKDISKLLLPATTLNNACYRNLFYGCSSILKAPKLPATTMKKECYSAMFENCASLIQAPDLPSKALAEDCYSYMFLGCSSLTTAPELPATTLKSSCYSGMFRDCSSLTTAPILKASTLPSSCYSYMFTDCSSLTYIKCLATSGINTSSSTTNWTSGIGYGGTFVKAQSATWPSGVNGIPSSWTIQNA